MQPWRARRKPCLPLILASVHDSSKRLHCEKPVLSFQTSTWYPEVVTVGCVLHTYVLYRLCMTCAPVVAEPD